MKNLLIFFGLISFVGISFTQNFIIGNVENCPFTIKNVKNEKTNADHKGKAYKIKVLINSNLENLTVSAIGVDKDGTVKGMDSKNFKGDFNEKKPHKIIIKQSNFKIELIIDFLLSNYLDITFQDMYEKK